MAFHTPSNGGELAKTHRPTRLPVVSKFPEGFTSDLAAFESKWRHGDSITMQLVHVSDIRNSIILLMAAKDNKAQLMLTSDLIIYLHHIFLSCLKHGTNLSNFELTNRFQAPHYKRNDVNSHNYLGFVCLQLGDPSLDDGSIWRAINILNKYMPTINKPSHQEIMRLLIQLGELRPPLFRTALFSSTINILYPKKANNQFLILDAVIDQLIDQDSKLLDFNFIDCGLEMTHNHIPQITMP